MSLVYCVTISGRCRHILGPSEFRTWCGARESGLVKDALPEWGWAGWPVCGHCERLAAAAQAGASS